MADIYFSKMEDRKEIAAEIRAARKALVQILEAPHAAKENLMKTDYKTAATMLAFYGRLLQAESASLMAHTVLADRAANSEAFSKILKANLPELSLPEVTNKKRLVK
jgi:hypothetical protein